MSVFPTCKGFDALGAGRGQRPKTGQMEELLEEIGDPRFGAVGDMALFQVDRRCRMFLFRSYEIKPPWTLLRENSECYVVRDANGVTVAWLFCRDDTQRFSFGVSKLSSDEARRIGKAIARIPNS